MSQIPYEQRNFIRAWDNHYNSEFKDLVESYDTATSMDWSYLSNQDLWQQPGPIEDFGSGARPGVLSAKEREVPQKDLFVSQEQKAEPVVQSEVLQMQPSVQGPGTTDVDMTGVEEKKGP